MKHTKNIAVIDIGSNTIRLHIGNLDNNLNKIYTERVVTRLGKGLTKSSFLSEESIKISINTLKKFKNIIEKYDVFCTIAFGTSALRETRNSKDFCELVERTTGIKVNILSEKQEAYYTFLGTIEDWMDESEQFILDIGGGSTEWIYYNNHDLIMDSIPYGVLKIKEIFFFEDPLLKYKIKEAKKFLTEKIKNKIPLINIKKVIATGGTASTVGMIFCGLNEYNPEKTHGIEISYNKIKAMFNHLSNIPISEREKVKGVLSDRADIICGGLLILDIFLELLNAETLIISEKGIIEGVMKNYKDFCYNNFLL